MFLKCLGNNILIPIWIIFIDRGNVYNGTAITSGVIISLIDIMYS